MIHDIAPKKIVLPYRHSTPAAEDTVFVFRGNSKKEDRALMKMLDSGDRELPTYQMLLDAGYGKDPADIQYLFSIDEKEYFMLKNHGADDVQLEGFTYEGIRSFCDGPVVNDTSLAGMTAYHLFTWYRDNICCGRCGEKMIHFGPERAVQCPACGNLVFPKLMPAVIICVRNGEKVLVSRYNGRVYRGIALLAGFVEVGESLEQTVAREVMEEVGLKVKNITYYGSQPWGVDCDLLMGFYCDVDGSTEIHRDEDELSAAGWIERSEIPPRTNTASLTATLIEAFRTGEI